MSSRSAIEPILSAIPAARQKWARHYGVHPYFTRRPANVVAAYVNRYTRPGDVVLDPFGGSGVTAIEALLSGRVAIHNDLNPFANFMTAIIADTSLPSVEPLTQAFERVQAVCEPVLRRLEAAGEAEIHTLMKGLALPANIRLPRNSDAEFFYDLFTPRQLAGLAILKNEIDSIGPENLRGPLLLAWSASVAKLNKTFLSAKGRAESRGGSSIFSIYRYKLAKQPVELPIWETFRARFENILAAKSEVFRLRDYFARVRPHLPCIDSTRNLRILSQDASTLLDTVGPESVDYIFTDPPYGGHIAYLDLSILWNHWLGFAVDEQARRSEAIVGGECALTEQHYKRKLADSVRQCVAMLRPDRWLSIVFQHWDVTYFSTILETVSSQGARLKAAVIQEADVVWSMHKKKNSQSVLSGEMILTFYKPAKRHNSPTVRRRPICTVKDFSDILGHVLASVQAENATVSTESLFNRVILEAWENQCLSALSVSREGFAEHLRSRGWQYDPKSHQWRRSADNKQPGLWEHLRSKS